MWRLAFTSRQVAKGGLLRDHKAEHYADTQADRRQPRPKLVLRAARPGDAEALTAMKSAGLRWEPLNSRFDPSAALRLLGRVNVARPGSTRRTLRRQPSTFVDTRNGAFVALLRSSSSMITAVFKLSLEASFRPQWLGSVMP